jgi:hypothetical protein
MTERYIVTDAPGYYGRDALIYASCATLIQALSRRAGKRRLAVYSDGGFAEHNSPGNQIPGEFLSGYRRFA